MRRRIEMLDGPLRDLPALVIAVLTAHGHRPEGDWVMIAWFRDLSRI